MLCLMLLKGEQGLNGPPGQSGPPGPMVRAFNTEHCSTTQGLHDTALVWPHHYFIPSGSTRNPWTEGGSRKEGRQGACICATFTDECGPSPGQHELSSSLFICSGPWRSDRTDWTTRRHRREGRPRTARNPGTTRSKRRRGAGISIIFILFYYLFV